VKIARSATGRPAVIVFDRGFHGRTLLTLTMTEKVVYKAGFGPFAPEVYRVAAPSEPVRSGGFIRSPRTSRAAARAVPATGAVYRAGCSRRGPHRARLGERRYGVEPDRLCRKVARRRLPLAAVTGRAEMDAPGPAGWRIRRQPRRLRPPWRCSTDRPRRSPALASPGTTCGRLDDRVRVENAGGSRHRPDARPRARDRPREQGPELPRRLRAPGSEG
jgi:hypothetical protein